YDQAYHGRRARAQAAELPAPATVSRPRLRKPRTTSRPVPVTSEHVPHRTRERRELRVAPERERAGGLRPRDERRAAGRRRRDAAKLGDRRDDPLGLDHEVLEADLE